MSSPKEVAAEAFSLLNSTLENPEARVEELTRELWRKRPTKNNLENSSMSSNIGWRNRNRIVIDGKPKQASLKNQSTTPTPNSNS